MMLLGVVIGLLTVVAYWALGDPSSLVFVGASCVLALVILAAGYIRRRRAQ